MGRSARLLLLTACLGLWACGSSIESGTDGSGGGPTTNATVGSTTSAVTTGTGSGEGGASGCHDDCSQIDTPPCLVSVCDPGTHLCTVVSDDDGMPCDDGLFCTVDDV